MAMTLLVSPKVWNLSNAALPLAQEAHFNRSDVGGQLLRALAEYYPDPPMRNLVTVGSQHMGIDLLACP